MTKMEERNVLELIVNLIQSTPMDSYIRSAFSGVPEYAVRNIEEDAAYNPVEERDMWEKRCAEKSDRIDELCMANVKLEDQIHDLDDEVVRWKNTYTDSVERYEQRINEYSQKLADAQQYRESTEKVLDDMSLEILKLKAEIYDLRKKERDNDDH